MSTARPRPKQIAVPLSSLFADPDPDPSVTAVAFRAQILRSAVARGNAYADLLGAEMGTPTGAVTIHPDRVRWRYEHTANGYTWQVYVDGKPRSRWPYGDLWHFPLFQQPGSPVGLNPVEYHRLSIGASLAAQVRRAVLRFWWASDRHHQDADRSRAG